MDESKIIKKVTSRRRPSGPPPAGGTTKRRVRLDQPEEWRVVKNFSDLSGSSMFDVVKRLCELLGVKVEVSTHGNLRLSEYLTQEQEQALLGDSDRTD